MSVYITRINGLSFNDLTWYKQHMVAQTAHRLGIREMGIYRYNLDGESDQSLSSRIDGIIAGINKGDLVICQFPTGNGQRFEWKLLNHLKAYGARVAIFLQELEPLSHEEKRGTLRNVIDLYNQAEVMIVPSLVMRQFLLDNHIKKDMKFVIQEMWDYSNVFSPSTPVFKKEIEIIDDGLLKESQEWTSVLPIRLYGGRNGNSEREMTQDEVFTEISKGGFGLVWYKNKYDRQYMEYSISFSLAKFLAAGIPVIVPNGISNQSMIEVNHLGLIVHSLEEAKDKIEAMNAAEYQEHIRWVGQFAPALRNGYYTEKCLIEAMQAFYRKDAGRLSIPTTVYSLENPHFYSIVLKKSYGGNLVLSWKFKGNTDGFLIYDATGRLVAETDNAHQHHWLIKGYGKESGFSVKAYMETLKGKLIVAESKLTYLDIEICGIPKVSLIIPAYNAEKSIVKSIDSALSQAFSDLEIIVVDDGSKDSTLNILEWYAENYSNVKVIHQKNSGAPAARNAGIEQASGEYIGFMDSDDMIYPDMIERLYDSAKKNKCDIAVTSAYYITDKEYDMSVYSQYSVEEDVAINTDRFFDIHFINAYQFPVVWNKLYRASLLKKRPFPLIIYEDEAWLPYILSYADRICYLNEGLYEYDRRFYGDTLTHGLSKKSSEEIFIDHKKAIFFYLENGNPMRLGKLKSLAQRELSLFTYIYKNAEYEELRKQIVEMQLKN